MRKKYYIVIFIYLSSVCFGYALETDTHKLINEKISKTTINDFTLDSYLSNSIDPSGIGMNLGNLKAWEWLRDGGEYEDLPHWYMPYLRSVNHFHNPLVPLEEAGFSGIWGSGFLKGESAVAWSQEAAGAQSPGGQYSWHDVRGYFRDALTTGSATAREEALAETFRGLGQLMHLVQDMSVPEHTRNDGHYRKAYEYYVLRHKDLVDAAVAIATADPSKGFALSELSQPSPFSEAPVPIARLFDTQRYNGSNPEVTTTPNIGLAEYTNANFLSGDTMFAGLFSTTFPYPSIATSVRTEDKDIPDPFNPGATVKRPYYIKIADGETGNGQGYRLAGVDYLSFYRSETNEFENAEIEIIPPMDDYVFADYAKLLLPRAVGYSATLLHYFFRGKMETTALEKLDNDGNVTELLVNVKNTTSNEMMDKGYFTLAYRYKPNGSDQYVYVTKGFIPSGELAPDSSKQLSFVITEPDPSDPSQITGSPIPFDATEKQYTLVYSGTLGLETGAVVGKVVEVTPAEIAITAPEHFVYALADDGLPDKSFCKLRMRLRDNAPTIAMTGGSVTATAKYKIHLSHTDDLANEPPDGFERANDFTTVASLPVEIALDETSAKEIEFDFSANPIPFGITDLSLEVTYKLDEMVIAFGTKNLNEPQYVGVWNSHDRFLIDFDSNPNDSVHDWQMLTQDEIFANGALVELLDTNNGGLIDEIIDPVDVDIDVAFVAEPQEVLPENYHASFSHIPAGRFGRLAFIADQSPVFALFHDRYTSSLLDSSDSDDYLKFDGIGRYFFPGVANQQVQETYYYTPIYLFRGVKNHFSYISVGLFPKPVNRTEEGMAIKEADWPAPASMEPFPATTIKP